MFVKLTSPDGTQIAVNASLVRAIYKVHDKRCNVSFGEEKSIAVAASLDDTIALLTPEPPKPTRGGLTR